MCVFVYLRFARGVFCILVPPRYLQTVSVLSLAHRILMHSAKFMEPASNVYILLVDWCVLETVQPFDGLLPPPNLCRRVGATSLCESGFVSSSLSASSRISAVPPTEYFFVVEGVERECIPMARTVFRLMLCRFARIDQRHRMLRSCLAVL